MNLYVFFIPIALFQTYKQYKIYMKIPRKCHDYEAQPSSGISRRRVEVQIAEKHMSDFKKISARSMKRD